jgi:hypothetical protein
MKLAPAFAFIAASLALVTYAEPQPVPKACLCGASQKERKKDIAVGAQHLPPAPPPRKDPLYC